MKQRTRLWKVLSLLLALSLFAAACGSDDGDTSTTTEAETSEADTESSADGDADAEETDEEPAAEDTDEAAATGGVVKIGVLGPLTGGSAADGEAMVNGAQLAIDELNDGGGVAGYTFELVTADVEDQEPDKVATAVSRLIDAEEVSLIATGYASLTNFEIDEIAPSGIPYLISANSQQTKDIVSLDPDAYSNIWSLTPSFDAYNTELPVMLEELIESGDLDAGDRSVYVVTSDNAYSSGISNGLIETFEGLGWTILGNETVPFGEVSDWGSSISVIESENPTVVINTDFQVGNEVTFLDQFLSAGVDSQLFMQYGPSVPEFRDLTADDSDGVLYNLIGGPIDTLDRTVDISTRYEEAYGSAPGTYGVLLYEEVMLYADALASVGDPADLDSINAYIGGVDKDIASGRLVFDQDTHLAIQGQEYIPIQFFQLQEGGERPLVWPSTVATGSYQDPHWISE